MKAEALRAARERPNNLRRRVDLEMRGSAAYQASGPVHRERSARAYLRACALRLDPGLMGAKIGSSPGASAQRPIFRGSWEAAKPEAVDILRAQRRWSPAFYPPSRTTPRRIIQKRAFLGAKKQFSDQFAEIDAAIENDKNFAGAMQHSWRYAQLGRRAAESIAEDETALRLSPAGPGSQHVAIWHLPRI